MDLTMRNDIATVTLEALTQNTAKAIDWSENDEHAILVINASAETDITIRAGNGIQGVTDLVLNVPNGVSLVKLESGRFKNVSGVNKGKIVIVSTGTPSVGVAALI